MDRIENMTTTDGDQGTQRKGKLTRRDKWGGQQARSVLGVEQASWKEGRERAYGEVGDSGENRRYKRACGKEDGKERERPCQFALEELIQKLYASLWPIQRGRV